MDMMAVLTVVVNTLMAVLDAAHVIQPPLYGGNGLSLLLALSSLLPLLLVLGCGVVDCTQGDTWLSARLLQVLVLWW
jgi:hypothetical protein